MIKQGLLDHMTLGHPNYELHFFLFIQKKKKKEIKKHTVSTQWHGDQYKPIGYNSQKLDSIAKGISPCMRAIVVTCLKHRSNYHGLSPNYMFPM